MVFANLQENEKDAFFSLLDEYFSTRPDLFAARSGSDSQGPSHSSTAAVHRAISSNPEAASKVMAMGLKQIANTRSVGGGGNSPGSASVPPDNNESGSVADRIAAFSSKKLSSAGPPPVADKPNVASSLTQSKKFGDVDVSSAKGFVSSLRGTNKPASSPTPPTPPAFAPKQNNFAPPPTRRVASSSNKVSTPEPVPPPLNPRQQEEEVEELEEGEWVEALYDYNSGEAGDLRIVEGQRLLLTERTSDDWWTGEVNGKKGLFPASYVKLL